MEHFVSYKYLMSVIKIAAVFSAMAADVIP